MSWLDPAAVGRATRAQISELVGVNVEIDILIARAIFEDLRLQTTQHELDECV